MSEKVNLTLSGSASNALENATLNLTYFKPIEDFMKMDLKKSKISKVEIGYGIYIEIEYGGEPYSWSGPSVRLRTLRLDEEGGGELIYLGDEAVVVNLITVLTKIINSKIFLG